MKDWLTRNYGWQAKRREIITLAIVAVVLVLSVTVGPALIALVS